MMKTITIYVSTYQSDTLKIARGMVSKLSASLAAILGAEKIDLSDYDLIGFGSDINFAQHHRELLSSAKSYESGNRNTFTFSTRCRPFLRKHHRTFKKILSNKGGNFIGGLPCRGFDKTGPWVAIDGYNKARPNEKDILKTKLFASNMRRRMYPLAELSKMKKHVTDKTNGSPIYKHPFGDDKIAGKTTLLNTTTCIHCMECVNLCPVYMFEVREYENSKAILPTKDSNYIQCQACSGNRPTDSIFVNELLINRIRVAIREVTSDKL